MSRFTVERFEGILAPGGLTLVQVAGRWDAVAPEVELRFEAPGGPRRARPLPGAGPRGDGPWQTAFAVRTGALGAARDFTLIDADGRQVDLGAPSLHNLAFGRLDPSGAAALALDLRQRLAAEDRPQVAADIRRLLATFDLGEGDEARRLAASAAEEKQLAETAATELDDLRDRLEIAEAGARTLASELQLRDSRLAAAREVLQARDEQLDRARRDRAALQAQLVDASQEARALQDANDRIQSSVAAATAEHEELEALRRLLLEREAAGTAGGPRVEELQAALQDAEAARRASDERLAAVVAERDRLIGRLDHAQVGGGPSDVEADLRGAVADAHARAADEQQARRRLEQLLVEGEAARAALLDRLDMATAGAAPAGEPDAEADELRAQLADMRDAVAAAEARAEAADTRRHELEERLDRAALEGPA
ncbi:MAG: hypothetical protein H0V81_06285 [Solirubrobacterales bacterium]|nr:hypothetical protein [Solirubrobacterales bacterium]